MLIEFAVRQHYLDGLDYMYAHSAVGSVTKVCGWAFFQWKLGARQSMLCARLTPYAPTDALLEFLYATLPSITYCQVDVSSGEEDLRGVLPTLGFGWSHDIFVHAPSTEPLTYPFEVREGFDVEEVRTDEQRKAFAAVQDDAYTSILGASPGLGEGFFAALPSVRGPSVVSALVSHTDGTPVRAGQIFRSRGLVSGVNGAVLASRRGQHLGDLMYRFLAREARHHWGASQVLHYTMPTALRTVERVGWPRLPVRYERWDLTRSPWRERPFPPGS